MIASLTPQFLLYALVVGWATLMFVAVIGVASIREYLLERRKRGQR